MDTIERLKREKSNAEDQKTRALNRLDRTGEQKRGPDGDAELAYAEGKLEGVKVALDLLDDG